jgi:hypothetical protein
MKEAKTKSTAYSLRDQGPYRIETERNPLLTCLPFITPVVPFHVSISVLMRLEVLRGVCWHHGHRVFSSNIRVNVKTISYQWLSRLLALNNVA